MKKMKFCLLFTVSVITIFSCERDQSAENAAPNATQMLTEKPWKLLSYGYDKDKNGKIGSNEDEIRDCDRDDTYVFNKTGSGVIMENAMICDGNRQASQFSWTLTNNDTILDFVYGTAKIIKLSTDSLIITNSHSDPEKLMITYVR